MAQMYHVLCLIVLAICTGAIANYCTLKSCTNRNSAHTMCLYPSSNPAAACVNKKAEGLTNDEINRIVNKHNELRQKVASGKEKRGKNGPQPPAAFMPNLTWDNELAMIAQRWVNQCNIGHDKCRDVARYPVGQNLAVSGSSNENNDPVEKFVQMWYDEVDDFDQKFVNKMPEGNNPIFPKIGHYTQVVWAKTTSIGCGRIKYRSSDGWNNQLLICNYGPAGNYVGQPIYIRK